MVSFCRTPISHWLVKQKIKDDVLVLSELYTDIYRNNFNQIGILENKLNFLCDENDIEKMKDVISYNNFIQYIDIHLSDGQSCSVFNENKASYPFIAFPDKDQIVFGNTSLIASNNQFDEVRSHKNKHVLRFIFKPSSDLLSDCDNCLSMLIYVNNKPIEFSNNIQDSNLIVYRDKNKNALSVKFYINDNGNIYLVDELVNLFSLLIVILSVLVAISIELGLSKRRGISGLLNKAIESNELKPFYQPIVQFMGDKYKMVGAEVLVRWKADSGEYIPPNTFIPLAEQNGSIDKITDQLIDNVIQNIKGIFLPETFFISVNVSPGYLEKPNIAEKLLSKMHNAGLDPHHLSLEITERTKFNDLEKAAVCIETLTENGISIKLDDCGTGYGAFSYLHILNIDTIKIDRMFVDGIDSENFKNKILDSIIAFARESNLKVVAEGIETQEQANYLTAAGVEMLQGALFCDPVPFDEFKKLIEHDETIKEEDK